MKNVKSRHASITRYLFIKYKICLNLLLSGFLGAGGKLPRPGYLHPGGGGQASQGGGKIPRGVYIPGGHAPRDSFTPGGQDKPVHRNM